MKLKVLIALGCTLALTAVAIYSYFEADGYRNLISFAVQRTITDKFPTGL